MCQGDTGFRDQEEMILLRNERLRRHLSYVAEFSPFYRDLFHAHGVDITSVRDVEDLKGVPFTTKDNLAVRTEDFLCVPHRDIVDVCLTSGTTGLPVGLLQTAGDLRRVGLNEKKSFQMTGLGPEDRVLIAAALDRCFMAGIAYFNGLARLGAMAIRGGSSSVVGLVQLVEMHSPTAIVGVPTLLLRLSESLRRKGIEPASLGVDRLICIGEPVRRADLRLSALGERLTEEWSAQVFGTYASTEMATAFTDCPQGCGGHVPADLIHIEIVDPDGIPLPPGVPGEVVATPLGVTGMPLVRFRTGDIAALHPEPCGCGRKTPRLGPVLGRRAQMLKFRGTTLYPPAIFGVLEELSWVQGYCLEVYDDFELSDRVRVVVGSDDPVLDPSAIADLISARIRVRPEVVIVSSGEILRKTVQEGKRKPVNFYDYRNKSNEGIISHV